jgi:hypothetical protein
MVDAVNASYIPMGIEHDPRIPPRGRVVKAWLEELPDGATAVKALIEVFDGAIAPQPQDDTREYRTKSFDAEHLLISFDRNFRDAEDQEILSGLARSLNATLQEEFKKAFDAISVLAIGGAFILGGIAKGFLSKVGSDGYELLKSSLKKLFGRPKQGEKDRLLMLEFEIERFGERTVIEVIASNPAPLDIDRLLSVELQRLDKLVDRYFSANVGLKKLVFELEKNGITLKFGVRRDAVPLVFKSKENRKPNNALRRTRKKPRADERQR